MFSQTVLFLCLFLSIHFVLVRGEAGPCRFDTNFCSCKLGSASQGTCWDRIDGTPSSGGTTTYCRDEIDKAAARPIIELGSWSIGLSRRGLLENECKDLKWWHNGELVGEYGDSPAITAANVAREMQIRGMHTALELRRGDLLAFRLRNASYYCFTRTSTIRVNGQDLTLTDSSVSIMFARQHTENWFAPSFAPAVGQSEEIAGPADFVPLRTQLFSNGNPIVPGTDYWQLPDGTRDHERGNFYFRVQL
ncbi:unnamed protein product [Agarophyton chilense]